MKLSTNKLIVILGPTGSGKSDLAIKLAKQFNGQIISADSRQIYQEMDIGTAKVTEKQMQGIKHYLIDIVKPDQEFTLAQFKDKAIKTIKQIQLNNQLPFLVGGTGLYIQSIVDNLQIPEVKPDKKLRNQLERKTNQQLYNQLKKLDPQSLKVIDINNKRRMVRALEVCLITKKPFSQQKQKGPALFNLLQIGIKLDQKNFEQKVAKRIEQMIKTGLVEEVRKLIKKYDTGPHSLDSIGYQEIIDYLEDKISLEQAKQLIKLHTLQYARRQMTWFKRDKTIKWIKTYSQAVKLIKEFI
ncbi:MAG: tRNA (adenosine(37)-N6)-dimethylallyltransferase MiaA [Parcubacteria group bacterium]|jgi:tRNA dimethylallyltransferase|nr:tRNA (adenosine(37)-N6)-dimethylallyltransferase MiaA [Parcubacteria group bacterium]|tara:strand:- start:1475 stop:2368 length:894 start_codon:yes stop_codon:yes gene_type:complete